MPVGLGMGDREEDGNQESRDGVRRFRLAMDMYHFLSLTILLSFIPSSEFPSFSLSNCPTLTNRVHSILSYGSSLLSFVIGYLAFMSSLVGSVVT